MKFQRFIAMVSCLLVFLFLLTSCSGYNSVMRDHLSDEANYYSYRGKICDIYSIDNYLWCNFEFRIPQRSFRYGSVRHGIDIYAQDIQRILADALCLLFRRSTRYFHVNVFYHFIINVILPNKN